MSKDYKIIASSKMAKDLKKISPEKMVKKIIKEIDETILADPYIGTKLTNVGVGQWRYRIGDYRVRYDIIDDEIHIYRIKHRKDSYREK